jgi:hypothetical protein
MLQLFRTGLSSNNKVHKLKNRTKIQYWYKPPKEMLQHVMPRVLSNDDVVGIKSVDYTVGGDHGKGCFRMIMKLILRYDSSKPVLYKLFHIGNVDYAKDSLDVLHDTVLTPIGASLKCMMEEGKYFIVCHTKDEDVKLTLKFSCDGNDDSILCNVPTRHFIVGDLKFYAQMLGRENMTGSWCMWCKMSRKELKSLQYDNADAWTIEKLKLHKLKISEAIGLENQTELME